MQKRRPDQTEQISIETSQTERSAAVFLPPPKTRPRAWRVCIREMIKVCQHFDSSSLHGGRRRRGGGHFRPAVVVFGDVYTTVDQAEREKGGKLFGLRRAFSERF
jgi:hypothetical protein